MYGRKKHIFTAALFLAAVFICQGGEVLNRARSGDVPSQLQLAGEYFFGRNRQQNLTLALYWFRKAALAGNPQAQYNFGLCMLNGWGCEKNPAVAMYFFHKAMQQNLSKAAIQYAKLLFSGVEGGTFENENLPPVAADPARSIEILRPIANAGDNDARLILAKILFTDPVTHGRELRELLSAYVGSAADPDSEALIIYAACLRSGFGGFIPDPAAGFAILERAAAKNHPEAMAQLAEMLFNGFGVPVDRQRALALYDAAIKLGSPRALTDMGMLKLAGFMTAHDPAGAFQYFLQAAEKDYPPAMRKLGDCYAAGIGTAGDNAKAIQYYMQAAEAGDAQAAFILGESFRDGDLTGKNPAMAFNFFQLAARAGFPPALRETGKALLYGNGVAADQTLGMELLRRAAEAGDREAAAFFR